MRDELAADVRSFPFGRYVIFYATIKDGIDVVRVLHGARDIDAIFSEEPGFPGSQTVACSTAGGTDAVEETAELACGPSRRLAYTCAICQIICQTKGAR